MLVRSGPEAEIQLGSRPAGKASTTDNLSESGRMHAKGNTEARIQRGVAQPRSHGKWTI
jgi:hypothetical protein